MIASVCDHDPEVEVFILWLDGERVLVVPC